MTILAFAVMSASSHMKLYQAVLHAQSFWLHFSLTGAAPSCQNLKELFAAMSMKELKVENNLHLGISNFVDDFIKVIDEVKTDADIIHNWHISPAIASKVFSTLNNVLHGDEFSDSDTSESSSGEDEDSFDEEDEDSSNTEEEDGDVESYIDVGAFDGY